MSAHNDIRIYDFITDPSRYSDTIYLSLMDRRFCEGKVKEIGGFVRAQLGTASHQLSSLSLFCTLRNHTLLHFSLGKVDDETAAQSDTRQSARQVRSYIQLLDLPATLSFLERQQFKWAHCCALPLSSDGLVLRCFLDNNTNVTRPELYV